MTRKRLAIVACCIVGLLGVLALSGLLVVRSAWFRERLRLGVVSAVETATGGRVEIAAFALDWRRMRVEATGFTIHGTEPAGKPPLFHAATVEVGLKIVSVLERKADIQSLDVSEPHVYLIVDADGRTNVPAPKTASHDRRTTVETVLDLAIGRFSLKDGVFEVESRGSTPFDVRGRGFRANLAYERAGPRYRGSLSVEPLDLNISGYAPTQVNVAVDAAVERNRVLIASATLLTGASRVRFSGAVEDLSSPHGSFQYDARVSQADVARFLETKLLESGTAQVTGRAVWNGGGQFSAQGALHASNLEYRDASIRLRGFRADGAVTAGPHGVDVAGLHLTGFYAPPTGDIPVDARIERATVRGADLGFQNVAVSVLGGGFQGKGRVEALDHFRVEGDIDGFQARRVVAVYSPAPLPWDGRASGPITLEGSFRNPDELHVFTRLAVAPEPGGAPVRGRITATYDAASGILDLGRSTLTLPASRVDFNGALGGELRVRLETRDLGDLLPAVGEDAASFPLQMERGSGSFEGVVSGQIDDPQIAGRLRLAGVSFFGKAIDSLSADAAASPEHAGMDNAVLAAGGLRAQFRAEVALQDWKTAPDSPISASITMRNASLSEVASLAEWQSAPITGALNATAQASGTVANPVVQGDVDLSKGSYAGEPFDRVTAHIASSTHSLEVSSAQIAAGAKQVRVDAAYSFAEGDLTTGRLRFQVSSNAMPLDQIHALAEARPGLLGTVQATAAGAVDIRPATARRRGFDVAELRADVSLLGIQLEGQSLGNARLTATSEGKTLRARLDSNFAGSAVHGEGSWNLEDDYPGKAAISFSRLDLARLRDWLAPSASGSPYTGAAEGELTLDGPLLRLDALKAELRIPKFEFGLAPGSGPAATAEVTRIHNNGPIVVAMANNVVTIGSAHLEGRGTDLTIAGRAPLTEKSQLDLRVNGQVDLGVLEDFFPGLNSGGSLVVAATLRGRLDNPQLGGRAEVRNASLNSRDFPNGLSNANGVLLFTGGRATIQTLSGESGGGKVTLTGFAGNEGGLTVFRLRVTAQNVRVRYPEGVSTVANANLSLTGSPERSMLTGTVTVLRTGFNPEADFSSVVSKSSGPAQTPAAPSGPLGGLNFDIQVQTAPDVQVQSSLTQDIGVEANLRLRGTVNNPGVQGRINITHGQLLFFGTRYNINQGSIAFYNQAKIEPVLNVDLETKAKGIDVTLTVSGPLDKLNLTPRSDPPLQFNEIVAFLASGQAPTSDPALLAQTNTSPQSWQQMGASALLGQAIGSPVTGRLERFFGVSRLRIDPTLPGVQYNPQARITLEQQITPAITFTYITVINSSNPQVVSVDWNVSKQWSVSALREENGVFGLDFFVKRQFK